MLEERQGPWYGCLSSRFASFQPAVGPKCGSCADLSAAGLPIPCCASSVLRQLKRTGEVILDHLLRQMSVL